MKAVNIKSHLFTLVAIADETSMVISHRIIDPENIRKLSLNTEFRK